MTMAQMGFFDLSDRYASLDTKRDPLVEIDAIVPREEFRPVLERVRNCCVIYTQAFQEVGRGWLGNGKPQPRSSDWSRRPAMRPWRASPNAAAPIPVLSPWSASSPGRPRAISSNRRRRDYPVTASPSKEARA